MSALIRLAAVLAFVLVSPALAQPPVQPPSARTVLMPVASSTPAPAPQAKIAPVVDVNSASLADIIAALPGVGPVYAEAIVKKRPYIYKEDLVKKGAIGQALFDKIKARVGLVNVNTTSAAEMKAVLTGIGDARSEAIVKGRPYAAITDLVKKGVLTQGQFEVIMDEIVVK